MRTGLQGAEATRMQSIIIRGRVIDDIISFQRGAASPRSSPVGGAAAGRAMPPNVFRPSFDPLPKPRRRTKQCYPRPFNR